MRCKSNNQGRKFSAKSAVVHTAEAGLALKQGLDFHQSGRLDEARQCYKKVLAINANYFDALQLLATLELQVNNLSEADRLFGLAIKINPNSPEVYNNRGLTLHDLKRFDEALVSFMKAINLNPHFADAFNNQGNTYKTINKLNEALLSYSEAIKIDQSHLNAHRNKGNLLRIQGRFDEALIFINQAIQINPNHADAYYIRGLIFHELHRFDDAFDSYNAAIRINPNHVDAHYTRGLLALRLLKLKEGFSDYRYRWTSTDYLCQPIKSSIPECEPGVLSGRILLWAEQGIGDEIFYAGMLRYAFNDQASITISADKRLHSIFRRSFPEIQLVDKALIKESSVDQGYVAQSPFGDLGYLLGLDEGKLRAKRASYLSADPVRKAQLLSDNPVLGSGLKSGLVCGISWCSANQQFGHYKSIQLLDFEPILATHGVGFVNLQYGDVDAEINLVGRKLGINIHQMKNLDLFNDIEGLLALIDVCDIIVTTSNVTAHLAGALGKPAAVIVPSGKGRLWYWHEGDGSNIWYPSLHIFSQENPSGWAKPLQAVAQWMKRLV